MRTWNVSNIHELTCLAEFDVVEFPDGLRSKVCASYLEILKRTESEYCASPIINVYADRVDAATLAYGYAPAWSGEYSWPWFRRDDFAAATRLVKLIFRLHQVPNQARRDRLMTNPRFRRAFNRAGVEAIEKAAREAAAAAEKAKRDREEMLARLNRSHPKAREVYEWFEKNPGAFGCQQQKAKELFGVLLGCQLP